uniref:Centromere protein I-like n=1 Tax=Phallusia mammillata TaxID=59560 RepID=A0A6F9D8F6_9ASCI|nr:centromere protein I-like [Phallusia mammillata]
MTDMQTEDLIDEMIAKLDSSQKNETLLETVKSLRNTAGETGLSASQITSLCKIGTSGKFNSVVSGQIIKSLIPRENVPEEAALLILSKLCADAQSLKVQHLLLKWLVLVFDLIATKSKIHSLYSIIFHFIESEILCPTVCHLLFMLTRKCDVTHYRISKLLTLQKKIGSQPYLCGLLTVYKMYQPSLISMSGRHRVFFRKTDKSWNDIIQNVQQKYGLCVRSERLLTSPVKMPKKLTNQLMTSPKCSMVHENTQASFPISQIATDKIPMHRIKSFQEVLDNFSKLDLSCQSHTLLSSTTLQHIVAVTSDRTVPIRLNFWFNLCLRNELIGVAGETTQGTHLLKTLLCFIDLTQECPPACESFLFRYLCTWNGFDYRVFILKLITKLKVLPFTTLQSMVLAPLYKLYIFSTHVFFKCSVIGILTELLRNYVTTEVKKYEQLVQVQYESTEQFDDARHSIFSYKLEKFDANQTIQHLIQFIDDLCVEGMETDDNNYVLYFYFIQFYKLVSRIYTDHGRPVLSLPSKAFFQKLLFCLDPSFISSLCGILMNYKEVTTQMKQNDLLNSSHQDQIKLLNQYLVDTFYTLWRRRAFHPSCSDSTVVYAGLESSHQDLSDTDVFNPKRMFALDRHPAFVAHAANFLSVSKRDGKEAINGEFVFEESFKEYLESHCLAEIPRLIQSLTTT